MLKYEGIVTNYFYWPILEGGSIIPRSLKSDMTPFYFLKIVFPKFDPLTVTGMAICVDLGPKCHSLRLRESSLA